MSLGVATDFLAAELAKTCWKFQCVGVKIALERTFSLDFTRAGIQIHARSVFADKIIFNK